jgi:hypothetical protein
VHSAHLRTRSKSFSSNEHGRGCSARIKSDSCASAASGRASACRTSPRRTR